MLTLEPGLFCCSLAGNRSLLAAEIARLLLPAPTSFRVSVDSERVDGKTSLPVLPLSGLYIQNIASLLIATATYPKTIQIQQREAFCIVNNIAYKRPLEYLNPATVLMQNHLLSPALTFGFYF